MISLKYSPNPVLLKPGNSANQLWFLRLVISQLWSPERKLRPKWQMKFNISKGTSWLLDYLWECEVGAGGRCEKQGKWLEHSCVLEAPTCPFRTHVPQKISQSPLTTWLRQRTASTTPIPSRMENKTTFQRTMCSGSWQVAQVGWLSK